MRFRTHSRGLALGAIALSLVITAELQFAIKDWSNLGLGYLYLLPVVIAGSPPGHRLDWRHVMSRVRGWAGGVSSKMN